MKKIRTLSGIYERRWCIRRSGADGFLGMGELFESSWGDFTFGERGLVWSMSWTSDRASVFAQILK